MKKTKICGDCTHWERAEPYNWGECKCPLPESVITDDLTDPLIQPTDIMAEKCDCFKPEKETSK